jgi:hypothetical protein
MARIFMHCPLNISRTLEKMMEEFCQQWQQKHGIEVQIKMQPHRPDEESLFQGYLKEGGLPDLTLGHVNDFADLAPSYLEQHCLSLPGRFPIRKELAERNFIDAKGYFHPFAVIPFAMFYNRNLVNPDEAPKSWRDLASPRWRKRILMPDDFRMVSVIVKASMEADLPDYFKGFEENVTHQSSPLEVVNAVDEGKYHIGITNIAFARISSQKNISIIWPQEGMFCMPMIMTWSKAAPEPMLEIGDFLMSRPVQEFLAMQSFVPASDEVPLPPLVAQNNCNLRWKDWQYFLKVVKGRHA